MFGFVTSRKYRELLAVNTRLENDNHYLVASGARLARELAMLKAADTEQQRQLWLMRGEIKKALEKLKGELPAGGAHG